MYETIVFGEFQRYLLSSDKRGEILSSELYLDRITAEFSRYEPLEESVVSFDVFDTILLRDNSSELHRFLEIGSNIPSYQEIGTNIKWSKIDWFLARQLGTKASYRATERRRNSHEGSIYEIYKTACALLGLPKENIELLVARELEYEKTHLSIAKNLVRIIEMLKRRGSIVVLLSDMYLRGNDIRHLLSLFGVNLEIFDNVYSSADSKLTKSSGLSFEMIDDIYPKRAKLHIGDNFCSDYIQPRRRGWSAIHLPLAKTDLDERRACHDATMTHLLRAHGLAADVERP